MDPRSEMDVKAYLLDLPFESEAAQVLAYVCQKGCVCAHACVRVCACVCTCVCVCV